VREHGSTGKQSTQSVSSRTPLYAPPSLTDAAPTQAYRGAARLPGSGLGAFQGDARGPRPAVPPMEPLDQSRSVGGRPTRTHKHARAHHWTGAVSSGVRGSYQRVAISHDAFAPHAFFPILLSSDHPFFSKGYGTSRFTQSSLKSSGCGGRR